MGSSYLVTTAIEETWPRNPGDRIIFLGKWCTLYSRKAELLRLDYEFVEYHWDDRKKLKKDYIYLQDVYEKTLSALSQKLNVIHNVNYSERYWRILIGPWLLHFIHALFDRWSMLEKAFNNYKIDYYKFVSNSKFCIPPLDMGHFDKIYIDDEWNEHLYYEIFELLKLDSSVGVGIDLPQKAPSVEAKGSKIKAIGKKTFNFFYNLLPLKGRFFFLSTYLPKSFEFRLQASLLQFPKFNFQEEVKLCPKSLSRNWSLENRHDIYSNSFEYVLSKLVHKHIPIAYIENYTGYERIAAKLNWASDPKLIFTSNSYQVDDLFKIWAAKRVEFGAKLVIGQHGGNYGISAFYAHESHQVKISDIWLSWGWSDPFESNVFPFANLKTIGIKIKRKRSDKILLVAMDLPRYSYHLFAGPISTQWLDYFDDQKRFVDNLPNCIKTEIRVRLYKKDSKWFQKERWIDYFPNIKFDGTRDILKSFGNSKLVVCTYNATSFIEALSLNVPTLIFWNPDHWELRTDAEFYFDKLAAAGIFHSSAASAAEQIGLIWDDVDGWWESEIVQESRKIFCSRFSRSPHNSLEIISNIFKGVAV